jgi:hypothetical protein
MGEVIYELESDSLLKRRKESKAEELETSAEINESK